MSIYHKFPHVEFMQLKGRDDCRQTNRSLNTTTYEEIGKQQNAHKQQMKKSLRQENRYKEIFEHFPFAIVCMDAQGNISDCNNKASQLFGIPKKLLVGFSYRTMKDEKMANAIVKALSGEESRIEGDFATVAGNVSMEMCAEFSPTFLPDGSISGVIGIFQDISERKEIQKELRLSKNRINDVMEIGLLATSSPNLDVMLPRVLKRTIEVAGASVGMIFIRDQASGLLRWGASHGLSEEFVNEYSNRNIKFGEGLTGMIAQTGEPIYIHENSSSDPRIARPVVVKERLNSFIGVPIYAGDEIIGVMNILTRKPHILRKQEVSLITAIGEHIGSAILNAQLFKKLQEAEASLKAEQYFMDTLLNAMNDTFFVFEANTGRAIRWNKVFGQTSGYSDQEIVSQKVPDAYFSPQDLRKTEAAIVTIKKQKKTSLIMDLITKDQRRIPFEYSVARVKNPLDHQTLIIAIGRDLSERKMMEQEILKSQKLESIGILAGGIAHDFNNLLTSILGNISLAKIKSKHTEDEYNLLENAEKASSLAKELTKQLLTFAKGGNPVKKSVDLTGIINDTANFVLHGSNIACQLLLQDDLKCINVDVGQISQVFQNLLINAIQAMPGGGTITICANNFSQNSSDNMLLQAGEYVLISISDQGYGISPENLSKIFDPFYTTKPKGSGLGLATSYSIVKNHNGHISVELNPDGGTTFKIYLPASKGKKEKVKKTTFQQMDEINKKILVMDDDERIRKMVSIMLQNLGCEVSLAQNGQEAIALYCFEHKKGQPFDAVIMDLTIPGGMGGKDTIGELLKIDPNITALASSGYANDPIMANFSEYGFKGCLGKPFTFHELSEAIQNVIR